MKVNVSTTTQTGTFTTIATYNHSNTTSGGYITCTVDLSAYSSNEVFLQFEKASTTTSNWRIDWVKVESVTTCTSSTLNFLNPTESKSMADAPFTVAATSLNGTTPVAYTSNNTNVATVNATTGEVTLVAAGSAIITATQAAGTHNTVDYCAATATYTLNVASIAPTITVTEVNVPAMSANVDGTDTEVINVSGINLTEGLALALTGDNAAMFELSANTVAQTGGTAANTAITISYKPTAPGSHTATLTIASAGVGSVTRALTGTATWAPLPAPAATVATEVQSNGFSANWEAVTQATEYQLNVYTKTGTPVADLIFSEYCEGSSNNKYIEIYNGTGSSVNLSEYSVELYGNGASTPGNTLTLSGTLAHGAVYIIYNSGANSTVTALGNVISTVTYFNGDDALVLKRNGNIIDSFGQVGFDPGIEWSANGVSTLDKTLVRNPSVLSGRTNATSAFDPSVEWAQFNLDHFSDLGIHTSNSIKFTPASGSPFTVTGTSKEIAGLNPGATYYYTVVAKNANVTSAASNEISVTTTADVSTGVHNPLNNISVSVSGNNILFTASAGQVVEVYNAIGQKLVSRTAAEGLNSIPVAARGVVLVKVGDRLAKVIM